LTVPVGTLLGWSTAPGWAGGWELLDPDDTCDIVQAASQDPRTRWCLTFTGPDNTAVAHACATGQHRWLPPDHQKHPDHPDRPDHSDRPDSPNPPRPPDDRPSAAQAAQLADLLRALNAIPRPIAKGTCEHRNAEDGYTPSRKLKHLIRARTASCSAPGCGAQAMHCDLDHVVPHPEGATCECNLHPACRRRHRCKQAPGWNVKEPEPGTIQWTTPAGRTYTTNPTVYDL
jgi:hypothetical protein